MREARSECVRVAEVAWDAKKRHCRARRTGATFEALDTKLSAAHDIDVIETIYLQLFGHCRR